MKLFISYRPINWSFTHWLAEELNKLLDAEIVVDYSSIDESNFESSRLRKLRESDAVVLAVTEHTFDAKIHNEQDWVRREIREALQAKKLIALATVNGIVSPTNIPDDIRAIRGKQGVEFHPRYFKAGIQKLASLINMTTPIKLRSDAVIAPNVLNPLSANGVVSEKTQYEHGVVLYEAGQYDAATAIFDSLISKNYKALIPVALMRQKALEDRAREERRWEASVAYDQMLDAFNLAPAQIASAFVEFQSTYPEFREDPADLRTRITTWQVQQRPTSNSISAHIISETLPTTPDEDPLLRVMLDPKRRPVERAEAGREINKYGDPRPGVLDFDFKVGDYWCEVAAGEFIYQNGKKIRLPKFYIAKYPVTYWQYQQFLNDKSNGYTNAQWWKGLHADGLGQQKKGPGNQKWELDNHPRENVSCYDAMAYCKWLSAKLRYEVTLPTEEQWEKAARGTDGREYPWGNGYRVGYANIDESGLGGGTYLKTTTAVGIFPQGESPYHELDMSGNVWHWTLTEYSSKESNNRPRSLRGGSFNSTSDNARVASRFTNYPVIRGYNIGFRIVCSAPVP